MYIFRWLMKYPIVLLALFLVCCLAIVMYALSGGSSSPASVDTTPAANISEADLSKAPAIEPSTLTTALVDGKAEKSEATDAATETETKEVAETETPATEEVKVEEEAKTEVAETAAIVEETKEAVEEAPATESETTEAVSEEVAAEAETVTATEGEATTEATAETQEVAVVEETQFGEMSADELLLMAREAYWNNGLDESAEIYQQLIQSNPDVVDYKGELGNVYWRQGFPEKAAELYADISGPLLEAGKIDKVANMVGFIGLFFPEKATEIHNKLEALK